MRSTTIVSSGGNWSSAVACFTDKAGNRHQVGRFINFLDKSTSRGSLQPSFDNLKVDRRFWWEFGGLLSIANLSCGMGDNLMPFAFLCSGEHHSDDRDPTHGDLLCSNYSWGKEKATTVVYWRNDLAVEEYYRCEDVGEDAYTSMKL